VPYNPQHNVIERKNNAIVEIAKAMFHDLDMPHSFGHKLAVHLFTS
jgi:hypothetical protein